MKPYCILMRSGVQIWIEQERAAKLQDFLESLDNHKFVNVDGQSFNTADMEGIFDIETMETRKREKRGEFKCVYNSWHEKNTFCSCSQKRLLITSSDKPRSDEEQARINAKLNSLREQLQNKLGWE